MQSENTGGTACELFAEWPAVQTTLVARLTGANHFDSTAFSSSPSAALGLEDGGSGLAATAATASTSRVDERNSIAYSLDGLEKSESLQGLDSPEFREFKEFREFREFSLKWSEKT